MTALQAVLLFTLPALVVIGVAAFVAGWCARGQYRGPVSVARFVNYGIDKTEGVPASQSAGPDPDQ